MRMDDAEIVELYLIHDERAISETTRKYGARLRALSRRIVGDEMEAEECENDTYLGAWNAIPPHEPKSYLYAFLARITRHLSINRCRDRARLKRGGGLEALELELEECIPAPDDVQCRLEARELSEALNRFLASLGRERRDMFLRRYWFCDSVEEIARRFNCGEGKVKTALYRVRLKLREFLEKEGYVL